MISIKPKTRQPTTICTIEELIPHLSRISKNWRKLTPLVKSRLETLLQSGSTFSGLSKLYLVLRKDVLQMRSGTFSSQHYREIFGWSEHDVAELMSRKSATFKAATNSLTPNLPEFWIKHHGLTSKEAVLKVSALQLKLASRKKSTVNLPTSIRYYLHRGMSPENASIALSVVQKKRRNTCIEYWTSRGHTVEEAQVRVSKLQKLRSQFSIDYWTSRCHSLEQAQAQTERAMKKNLRGRVSKISRKFFIEVLNELNPTDADQYKFGDHEHTVQISPTRRMYLDFCHVPSKKVIEFDGRHWHDPEQDAKRDEILTSLGYQILRIPETYNPQEWHKYCLRALNFLREHQ